MPNTLRFLVLACGYIWIGWGCSSSETESAAPGEDWPTAPPEEHGFDSAALAEVVERINEEDLPIDSLLLVRNGVLILDAYFYPYLGEQPHDVASVTKSVTSTLVGIAIDQELLSLDQSVVESFPELAPEPSSDGKADVVLRHLLTMTSGLDCGRTPPDEPELFAMMGSDHFVKYALELPMAVAPGTEFAYCSPGSHLMSAMLVKASGMSALDFAKENLFGPLGITNVAWLADPQGANHGWGDLQIHPRDLARIGQLFLNKGSWNGVQIVSKDWVEQATKSFIVTDDGETGYGYQWWVLAGDFQGVYQARGRSNQAMIVWPDKDVVAVFTGRGIDVRDALALAFAAAIKADSALDPKPEAYARLNESIRNATEPPQAEPVPDLPPMALEVSGKVYQLAENPFDVRCISLRFDSPSDAWLDLTLSGVGSGFYELPVGMDGVPRFLEAGPTGIPVGVIGEWTEPTVFSMQYDEVAGTNHLQIRGDFEGSAESVIVGFSDPGESFPPQTVQGSAVASCN